VEDEIKSCHTLPDSHVITEVLDDVKDSCAIAVDILNDLLLYEKLDEGYFNISKTIASLSPFIDEAVRNFKMLAKSANVHFTLHCQSQELADVTVDMDKGKMHQVLRNLMSNALKFTRQNGTVSMKCELFHGVDAARDEGITFAHDNHKQQASNYNSSSLAAASADSILDAASPHANNNQKRRMSNSAVIPILTAGSTFIRLTVTDSGPGISASDQHALFHEFSQVKADKLQNGQGSGLGLWIAASIMKMHGGRIGVMSPGEGCGSSFIIDLPVIMTTTTSLATSSSEMLVDSPSNATKRSLNNDGEVDASKRRRSLSICPIDFTASFRRLKECSVLIVDDVASNRKMVRRILRDKFTFFEEAENGQEAVDKFTQALAAGRVFDVIMMDFLMPVMNGLEATTIIKAAAAVNRTNHGKHVVVVGVTGNGQEDDIHAFEDAGADAVLIKPLNVKKFDEVLAAHNFWLD
jgi:CheY-like chemotaxis protein